MSSVAPSSSSADDHLVKMDKENVSTDSAFDEPIDVSALTPVNRAKSLKRKKATKASDPDFICRKDRSLGLMCRQFLQCVQDGAKTNAEVNIEHICERLDVEKRRVYDIVNVMEALEAMRRSGNKSHYEWRGMQHLPVLMFKLRAAAQKEDMASTIAQVGRAMYSFVDVPMNDSGVGGEARQSIKAVDNQSIAEPTTKANRNSLSHLCRRFLMMLLVAAESSDNKSVSLDVASTILIKDAASESSNEPPSRSRCRRLYDIANVLIALELIEKKYYMFGTKKIPLFIYCGPKPTAHRPEPNSPILKRYPFALGAYRHSNDKENIAPGAATSASIDSPVRAKHRRPLGDLSPNHQTATPVRSNPFGQFRRNLNLDKLDHTSTTLEQASSSILRQQLQPPPLTQLPLAQQPRTSTPASICKPTPHHYAVPMQSTPVLVDQQMVMAARMMAMPPLPSYLPSPNPLLWPPPPQTVLSFPPSPLDMQYTQWCTNMIMAQHQQQQAAAAALRSAAIRSSGSVGGISPSSVGLLARTSVDTREFQQL